LRADRSHKKLAEIKLSPIEVNKIINPKRGRVPTPSEVVGGDDGGMQKRCSKEFEGDSPNREKFP